MIAKAVGRRKLYAVLIAGILSVLIVVTLTQSDYAAYGHGRCFIGDTRVRCDSNAIFKRNYGNIWNCMGDENDGWQCEETAYGLSARLPNYDIIPQTRISLATSTPNEMLCVGPGYSYCDPSTNPTGTNCCPNK